jgi:hypothetical protein
VQHRGAARAIETGIPRGTLVSLIDDDALAREAMLGLMSSWGCEVVSAASTVEAALKLACLRPHAGFDRVRLSPGRRRHRAAGDRTVALRIRRSNSCLSGYGRYVGRRAREIESAGLHALTKPVAPLRLRALVSQMLKARSAARVAAGFPA